MDDWKHFIEQQALVDVNVPESQQAVICPLEHLGLIKVNGEESYQFLQNLCSNDFAQVDRLGMVGAICNPKGRTIANFIVTKHQDGYYLSLPADMAEIVTNHLKMFLLMTKASIENLSTTYASIGLIATQDDLPLLSAIDDEHTIVIPHPDKKRIQIYAPPEQLIPLWAELAQTHMPSTSATWHSHDILSGFTWVYPATSGKILPQTLNIDLLGGISFSKGCYPGQEVVARMHYLGKLKKRTYLFSSDAKDLAIGDDVYLAEQTTPVGTIVDFAAAPTHSCGLVALPIADRDSSLYTMKPDQIALQIEPDPYPITATSPDPNASPQRD